MRDVVDRTRGVPLCLTADLKDLTPPLLILSLRGS